MAHQAQGSFDIEMTPQSDDGSIARSLLKKTFTGGLQATSTGQMLSFTTEVPASAGYVAMEQVSGTLAGRTGTFVLQHNGTMDRATPHLTVTVVPDSGTEGMKGLRGDMTIDNDGGSHHYGFRYRFDS